MTDEKSLGKITIEEERKRDLWKKNKKKRKYVKLVLEYDGYRESVESTLAILVRWMKKCGVSAYRAEIGTGRPEGEGSWKGPQITWVGHDKYDSYMPIFNAIKNYEYGRPKLEYFDVKTIAYEIDGLLRFNTMWYDEVAMMDFIEWLKDEGKI